MPFRTTAIAAAKARGWNKSELARQSGLSPSLISQLERGAQPGAKAISAIMRVFPDLPFERLFMESDSSKVQSDRTSIQEEVAA